MPTGFRSEFTDDLNAARSVSAALNTGLHSRIRAALRRLHPLPTRAPAPAFDPGVLTAVESLDRTLDDPEAPVEDVLLGFVIAAVNDYAAAEKRLIAFDFG